MKNHIKKSGKKILFGVAGEGLGHAARAKIVIRHLKKQGHQVKIITYHQGYWALKKEFPGVKKIFGLRFAHKNGKTTYPGTVLENIKKTPEATKSFNEVKILVKKFKPDIIFTDLEPFSSLSAHLYHIPLISIDNQHRITQGEVAYEKKWLVDYYLNKMGVSTVAFNAYAYIITSFFDFKITHPNTFIVPPILREEILKATPTKGQHILVYNTTSDVRELSYLLQKIPENFIIYGANIEKKEGNCLFKKQSRKEFLADLFSARAVIATAGFTLIAEAIHLKKPYLALPIKKRVEQLINAYYLKKLGYGNYSENLTAKEVKSFLKNIPRYQKHLQKYQLQDNSTLYRLLDKLLKEI
jgi:uncharacterized protein (TIGR00661 family)